MSTGGRNLFERELRWYPREWRERNGAAMIATLQDAAEAEGRIRLTTAERRNLAANGLGMRFGLLVPSGIRASAASFALATGAAFSLVLFLFGTFEPPPLLGFAIPPTFGPFSDSGVIAYAPWVVAFVLALAGRWTAARIAVLVAMVAAAGTIVAKWSHHEVAWLGPSTTTDVLLIALGIVVLAGRPENLAHPVRGLAVESGAVAATIAALYALNLQVAVRGVDWTFWLRPASTYNLGVLICVAVIVVTALAVAGRRALAGTIVVAGLPWFAAWLVHWTGNARDGWASALFVLALAVALFVGWALIRSRFEVVMRRRGASD